MLDFLSHTIQQNQLKSSEAKQTAVTSSWIIKQSRPLQEKCNNPLNYCLCTLYIACLNLKILIAASSNVLMISTQLIANIVQLQNFPSNSNMHMSVIKQHYNTCNYKLANNPTPRFSKEGPLDIKVDY